MGDPSPPAEENPRMLQSVVLVQQASANGADLGGLEQTPHAFIPLSNSIIMSSLAKNNNGASTISTAQLLSRDQLKGSSNAKTCAHVFALKFARMCRVSE